MHVSFRFGCGGGKKMTTVFQHGSREPWNWFTSMTKFINLTCTVLLQYILPLNHDFPFLEGSLELFGGFS